jgi:hypothetical protein
MSEKARQLFLAWLRLQPGNIKRAPIREQLRQYSNRKKSG